MDPKTAAMLSANDPERIRVEQEVCQTMEGREAWLQAVQEAEDLRVNLRNVAASPGAVDKVLRLTQPGTKRGHRSLYFAGVAAAIVLSVGGWWLLAQRPSEPRMVAATVDHQEIRKIALPPQVRQLALLAMANFESRDKALTPARDMEALLVNLPGSSNLPKHAPALGPLQQLAGGKVVSIDDRPALLTRWTETLASGEAHDIALQQIYAKELDLPADMNPVLVHIDSPDPGAKPKCDVLLWSRGGVAYMLVAHSSDGCARRALQALRKKMGPRYPASPAA